MFKIIVFFSVLTACLAAPPNPIRCGETPTEIFRCLGNPKVVSPDISRQCDKSANECDRINCISRASGWLDAGGDKVNKLKVSAHFDQFARDHPDWMNAVTKVKQACLSADLPPQGVYTNCPAYDVMECALTAFIWNAVPSQWSQSQECSYARNFAAACPVCPSDCFAPLIPGGSCRACTTLPHSVTPKPVAV